MNIKCNSRLVNNGDIFVAIKGFQTDGHDYIDEAIKNGASMVVAEHGLYEVDTLIVKDSHKYLVEYLKDNYHSKIKDIKLIGMTGTNGKTTTCFLIYQSLKKLGIKCAYMGTIGFYIDDKITELNNTTPDILDIYEMLLKCSEENCEYVVMEVSSHALDMDRVANIEFDYAIFSNLTKDHLDYHLDMKSYALAKQKLFYQLKRTGIAFVNNDDDYKNFFLVHNNNITYGLKDGTKKIDSYEIDINGSNFKIGDNMYHTSLIGKHNLYNILVVIIFLESIGISNLEITNIIKELKAPPGRMDIINYNDNIIVIDYAHTPDAVLNITKSFKEIPHNNLYTIVGCGGNRDKTKRSIMADLATGLSTEVIFTSDNPRNENPMSIIEDMVSNLDNTNYEIEENRAIAITKGIQKLNKNDILLVLGKGHEDYQIINGNKIHFSDQEIVVDYIK